MKKLVVLAVVVALFGCSKQAEQELIETSKERVELNTTDAIEVGYVDAQGNGVIDHDIETLRDYAACAVSEDDVFDLYIEHVGGVGYYLNGFGSSSGSHTTFAVELYNTAGHLTWEEESLILTCETTASTPCELEVQSAQTFTCENTSGSCGQTIIEGLSNYSCPDDHEFPWMVRNGKK